MVSSIQWWLLKTVVRWYVKDALRFSIRQHLWKEIYIGTNCGSPNGEDEKHLAYISRKDK